MPRTRLNLSIASLILAAGLGALGWFFAATPGFAEVEKPHMLWFVVGLVGTLFGLPLVLSFLRSHALVRQLAAGQGVVARWTIPAQAVTDFIELDRNTKPPNDWHPSRAERRAGVEAIFGAEVMVLGRRILPMASAGMERLLYIRITGGAVLALEVAIRSFTGGANHTASFVDRTWRIPVIDPEAANAAVRHFQRTLSGETIIAPRRWIWRLRGALVLIVLLPFVGLYGWYRLNEANGGATEQMIWPMIMTMTGILGTIGAVIVALIAWSFHRRQQGRR